MVVFGKGQVPASDETAMICDACSVVPLWVRWGRAYIAANQWFEQISTRQVLLYLSESIRRSSFEEASSYCLCWSLDLGQRTTRRRMRCDWVPRYQVHRRALEFFRWARRTIARRMHRSRYSALVMRPIDGILWILHSPVDWYCGQPEWDGICTERTHRLVLRLFHAMRRWWWHVYRSIVARRSVENESSFCTDSNWANKWKSSPESRWVDSSCLFSLR